jgi:hypothetical protein
LNTIIKALIGLASFAFLVAVVTKVFTGGWVLGIPAEAFSRTCTNLALIAIALSVFPKR